MIWIGIFIGVIAMQWRMEYRRRTFDPTLVFKYHDILFSEDTKKDRHKAANALLNKQPKDFDSNDKRAIHAMLGIFDDLGFHESGGQISAEVIHQHLYTWIRGYFQSAKDQVKHFREKELTDLEYVEELFYKTSQIEGKRSHRHSESVFLSPEDLRAFLIDETTA